MAVQDPSYPVYVDTSVIMGMTGDYNQQSTKFENVQYMPCTPDNGFFPDLSVVSPLFSASCSLGNTSPVWVPPLAAGREHSSRVAT